MTIASCNWVLLVSGSILVLGYAEHISCRPGSEDPTAKLLAALVGV